MRLLILCGAQAVGKMTVGQALAKITGFDEVSVCEDVTDHYTYWRECVNHNKEDCCNLRKG